MKLSRTIRGAARTACRILDVDNVELLWLLHASHGADELRDSHNGRASVETPARRSVRGAPNVEGSSDLWPGKKASDRPAAAQQSSEPQAEPSDDPSPEMASSGNAVLRKESREDSPDATVAAPSPPLFARQILAWKVPSVRVPQFPLCTLRLSPPELERVLPFVGNLQYWGQPFQLGVVLDSASSPVWHTLFELFAAVKRWLGPIFRRWVRIHGALLGALEGSPETCGDIQGGPEK